MRIAAIVMLAGLGSGAWGQEVYKCPKDGGGLAFQDHPCAGAKYEHDTPRPATQSLATAGTSSPLVSIATPPQAQHSTQSSPGNKHTVDLPVDTLNPPQQVLKGSPVWVSADQVVVTAFEDHAEVEFPEENSKCQVLLINTTKRSIRGRSAPEPCRRSNSCWPRAARQTCAWHGPCSRPLRRPQRRTRLAAFTPR